MFHLPQLNIYFDYEVLPKEHPLSVAYRKVFFLELPQELQNFINKLTCFSWDEDMMESFEKVHDLLVRFTDWQEKITAEASKQHRSSLIKCRKTIDPMSFDFQVADTRVVNMPQWASCNEENRAIIEKIFGLVYFTLKDFCCCGETKLFFRNEKKLRLGLRVLDIIFHTHARPAKWQSDQPVLAAENLIPTWMYGYRRHAFFEHAPTVMQQCTICRLKFWTRASYVTHLDVTHAKKD